MAGGFPCFWEPRACWDSRPVCLRPLHLEPAWSLHSLAALGVCVCVWGCVCMCVFLTGKTLKAVTVPETLTSKLIGVSSVFLCTTVVHTSHGSHQSQQLCTVCTVSRSSAAPLIPSAILCLLFFLLWHCNTNCVPPSPPPIQ